MSNVLYVNNLEKQIAAKNQLIAEQNQQLAAAHAACKVKDAALKELRRAIGDHYAPNDCYATGPVTGNDYRDLVECPACSASAHYDEALAIQPDDSALKAWLGEPVAIIGKHGHPKHISAIPSIEENRLYGPFEPLYAKPKGLK